MSKSQKCSLVENLTLTVSIFTVAIQHFEELLSYFLPNVCQHCLKGISEWSILVTTLVSSIMFTSINLMGEIIFKLVNNQNQVLNQVKIFPGCDSYIADSYIVDSYIADYYIADGHLKPLHLVWSRA